MQTFFQTVLFIFIIITVPVLIFLTARRVGQLIIGSFLLLALLLYYTQSISSFFDSHGYQNGLISWIIRALFSYQSFILNHWPLFDGFQLFGLHILSVNVVDLSFTTTWWPLIFLYIGGIVRLVVMRFVPSYRAREIAHEYWLYITSFLIILLIASSILDWNIFITIFVFLFILLLVATGIYRILGDILTLLYGIVFHICKWLWIGMKYIAFTAVRFAKFLHNILKHIRELYDTYIRGPFEWIHDKLVELEEHQGNKIDDTLNRE